MKFKIKQYQNRFKLKFSEKYYVFKKNFSGIWEGYREKGHEKMTVMFIPHNEKKIFNFQISKFTILFFMLLIMSVVGTSLYAIRKNHIIKREEQRLLMTYEDIRSHLLRFEKLTGSIEELVDDIKPEIEDLYELTAGTEESDRIWQLDEFDKKGLEELNKMKNILPEEIFTMKDLQKDLVCTTNTIKTVKNFIDVRSKVIKDTPSIVPNQGHITSLFGWRRSPFGHGRDFHTGIDIAAASGTIIRATAPGTVATAAWGGGYGNMIRIKHKYGFETIYGHCKSIAVKSGAKIKKGQIVGHVGQTGNSTGNHCHYEIRLGNIPINPYPYMSRVW
ncbi:MAG: M23 family metallopeptidase [bacterium]|nr:M23 family metallopeptidase [bacterium]